MKVQDNTGSEARALIHQFRCFINIVIVSKFLLLPAFHASRKMKIHSEDLR